MSFSICRGSRRADTLSITFLVNGCEPSAFFADGMNVTIPPRGASLYFALPAVSSCLTRSHTTRSPPDVSAHPAPSPSWCCQGSCRPRGAAACVLAISPPGAPGAEPQCAGASPLVRPLGLLVLELRVERGQLGAVPQVAGHSGAASPGALGARALVPHAPPGRSPGLRARVWLPRRVPHATSAPSSLNFGVGIAPRASFYSIESLE